MLTAMGFFDVARVPPAALPPSYRLPEWLAPADNIEPATVSVDPVLARTDALTLSIATLKVFPTGLQFELICHGYTRAAHPLFEGPSLIDGGLGFGVLFADGRSVISSHDAPRPPLLKRPSGPTLRTVSGGTGGAECGTVFWLWPLPPPGPLEFLCEWTSQGIPETGVSIDAAPLHEAAQRCRELWPDERDLSPTENDIII